jgi:hypothetical protein
VVDSKLVDFTLMPNLGPEFDATVRQPRKPSGMTIADLCINQTEYHPLQRFPVAVSIETKVAGANLEEGRMQLAIWTAAWHKRMEQLGLGGKHGPPLPTLPLILTHDQKWELFFAVDHREKIVRLCRVPARKRSNTTVGDFRPSADWYNRPAGEDIPATYGTSSHRNVG